MILFSTMHVTADTYFGGQSPPFTGCADCTVGG